MEKPGGEPSCPVGGAPACPPPASCSWGPWRSGWAGCFLLLRRRPLLCCCCCCGSWSPGRRPGVSDLAREWGAPLSPPGHLRCPRCARALRPPPRGACAGPHVDAHGRVGEEGRIRRRSAEGAGEGSGVWRPWVGPRRSRCGGIEDRRRAAGRAEGVPRGPARRPRAQACPSSSKSLVTEPHAPGGPRARKRPWSTPRGRPRRSPEARPCSGTAAPATTAELSSGRGPRGPAPT